jgi:hypothetical protein
MHDWTTDVNCQEVLVESTRVLPCVPANHPTRRTKAPRALACQILRLARQMRSRNGAVSHCGRKVAPHAALQEAVALLASSHGGAKLQSLLIHQLRLCLLHCLPLRQQRRRFVAQSGAFLSACKRTWRARPACAPPGKQSCALFKACVRKSRPSLARRACTGVAFVCASQKETCRALQRHCCSSASATSSHCLHSFSRSFEPPGTLRSSCSVTHDLQMCASSTAETAEE